MNIALASALKNALDKAFGNSLCTQVWLGYGDTLFTGFGEKALPLSVAGKPHPFPTYELQTHFADWFVEQDENIATQSTAKRYRGDEAISVLLNSRVVGWEFNGSYENITVTFEDGIILHILAWKLSELNSEQQNSDAWVLRLPDATHFAVSCSGVITFDKVI